MVRWPGEGGVGGAGQQGQHADTHSIAPEGGCGTLPSAAPQADGRDARHTQAPGGVPPRHHATVPCLPLTPAADACPPTTPTPTLPPYTCVVYIPGHARRYRTNFAVLQEFALYSVRLQHSTGIPTAC